jgi:hypothetical protein
VASVGERRSVCGILMGKPEGKRPLGKPRRGCGIILKWIFKK